MEKQLDIVGLTNVSEVFWNLSTPALYEQAVRRREGLIAHLGPLVVRTGSYTGRSPKDKFIVQESSCAEKIWWGESNQGIEEEMFQAVFLRMLAYLQGKALFVQDCYAGADLKYRVPIRVVTEQAWHNLFARNMFIQIHDPEELAGHQPEFTIIHAPNFKAVPEVDRTNSEAFILVHFARKTILIGGTSYAGEIKKSVFTVLNYLLPQKSILGMHCSANIGSNGDCALFFGLSGTGKTTLSTVNDRALLGDDEHGWDEKGIFNFEGGCYAKVIRISMEDEPEIYECTRKFGTILENVGLDITSRRLDLNDSSLTENTRAAYPISHIARGIRSGLGPHPKNIFMLSADAFGVLPPIARLTPEQAMYYFLQGYTAKVAGTEQGVQEPKETFSACFGAPFMALHPKIYARLLGEKIKRHRVNCWLVNTGWSGGQYGTGRRIDLNYTRAMVRAALNGDLDQVEYEQEPFFALQVPCFCPGVPDSILLPERTWADKNAYQQTSRHLARLFAENFVQFSALVDKKIVDAGPVIV